MTVVPTGPATGLRTTPSLRTVLLLTGAVAALAVLTGSTWLVLAAGAPAGLVLQAVLRRPRLDRVQLAVHGPARAAVGSSVRHELRVRNVGPGSTSPLTVTHHQPGLPPARVRVQPLPAGGEVVVEVTRTASTRGAARAGWATVADEDPLGLVVRTASTTVPWELVVHPAPAWPTSAVAATTGDDGRRGPRTARGSDLSGVREWRRGDESRAVHWRSTARHGRLVVAEREVRGVAHLLLVVVGGPRTEDDEQALAVAASTCTAALVRGDQVSLLAWARSGSPTTTRAVSPTGTSWTGGPGAAPGSGDPVPLPSPGPGATGVLDWFAALTGPAVPGAQALLDAALLAAADATGGRPPATAAGRRDPLPVNVLLTSGVPAAWWAELQALAPQRSVRPVRFP